MRFEATDAFDLDAVKALSPTGSFDRICIDIGGIAELQTVMSLLGLYFKAFRWATLIVKSKYLKTFLGNAQVYVPPVEQKQKQQSQRYVKHLQQQQQRRQRQQKQNKQDVENRHDSVQRQLQQPVVVQQQLQGLSLQACQPGAECKDSNCC